LKSNLVHYLRGYQNKSVSQSVNQIKKLTWSKQTDCCTHKPTENRKMRKTNRSPTSTGRASDDKEASCRDALVWMSILPRCDR